MIRLFSQSVCHVFVRIGVFFLCFIAQNLCLVQVLPLYKWTEHFTFMILQLRGALERTPGGPFCGLLDHDLL